MMPLHINPKCEIGAYEALWLQEKASFKRIAELFRDRKDACFSEFVDAKEADMLADSVYERFTRLEDGLEVPAGAFFRLMKQFPSELLNLADNPVQLLYYCGDWQLIRSHYKVSVVGSRKASKDGCKRAETVAKRLVQNGVVVVSGLAAGIDHAAHIGAILNGGRTIAVIGTPLDHYYPKENKNLQNLIARNDLVISQVPFHRYERQNYKINRFFFPERDITMAAISDATVIVEAGDTSGSLIQARAALKQGKKVFIMQSCFENPNITWPEKFEKKGAVRIRDKDDLLEALDLDRH